MENPDPILNKILNALRGTWGFIVDHPDRYNLQFIYTQIDRDSKNLPSFIHHPFHVDRLRYFYPASLVKLPVAALALEKINAISIAGLFARSRLQVENLLPCVIPYDNDERGQAGDPVALESSIKRMFLVSDNGGNNRLWEFLTRDHANRRLSECGFGGIRLLHRLAAGCTPEQNRLSNPVRIFDDSGTVLYEQRQSASLMPDTNPLAPVSFGKAFMEDGKLRDAPFTADYLNYAPLDDLHLFLIAVMFPDSVPFDRSMHLRNDDYRLLRTWMGLLPRESGMPRYASYPDNFKKLFLSGNFAVPLTSALREFNVIGRAYGFLSDLAYLADFERKIEFFLSATIYVNDNGIVNDDVYEYDSIGRPFLGDLCKAVYELEEGREKLFMQDLGEFLPDI